MSPLGGHCFPRTLQGPCLGEVAAVPAPVVPSQATLWGERAWPGPSHLPACCLEEPQRSSAVGPLLPSFLFGFQRDVWPFLQLNQEPIRLVGGRKLALPGSESGSSRFEARGCWSAGASPCGHLDAQILTWRPLRGQLVQPPASMQYASGPDNRGLQQRSGPQQPMQADLLAGLCDTSRPLLLDEPHLHHL